MEAELRELIDLAEKESVKEDSFGYLPPIIKILKSMLQIVSSNRVDPNQGKQLTKGIGRLVTEDFEFSESDLGTKILEVTDQFRRLYC